MKGFVFSLVSMILFVPLSAWGWNPSKQCPKVPSNSSQAQLIAGEMFSQAELDYQNQEVLKALKGFLCSHRIMQHENTLFNISQIAKLEEHQTVSVTVLKEFIKNEQRNHIKEPILEIIADIENDSAQDSGALMQQESAEEEPVLEQSKQEKSGDSIKKEQSLNKERSKSNRVLKLTGISMLAVGGAALVTGSVFQGLAGKYQTNAEQTDYFDTFEKEQSKMQSFQTGALISFISGGVIGTAGLIMFILSHKRERLHSKPLAIFPSGNGFIISGRF